MLKRPERKETLEPVVEPQEAAPAREPSPEPSRESGREPAVIGPSISIKGEVMGDGDLLVQGSVEGTLKLTRGKSTVTVGREGRVKAHIHARVVEVEGRVEGDLHGDERVVLRRSATVVGNIFTPRIALEDGCKFRGAVEMEVAAEEQGRSAGTSALSQSSGESAKSTEARRQSA